MKNRWSNLNLYIKTFVISFVVGLSVSFILLILGLFDLVSLFIPLGIFIGTMISSLSYLIFGKISDMNADDSKKMKMSMAVVFGRLLLLASLVVVDVFMISKLEITLFDPFGFLGAYFFTAIVYGIMFLNVKRSDSKKCE